jgi:hypothetical protein
MSDDTIARKAVDKLLGKKRYSVAVRVLGYYNIEVVAETEDDAQHLALIHDYTWDDLSYQGDVEIDQIEEIDE